ncbi:MAG: shikimate dehydrogenase [Flavobacteriia bacterium]|nr:shikimate dehydrogenase [Flavobacteriia bacterium]
MRKFGLLGKTLSHSFSKTFFTEFFSKEKIDGEYNNYELATVNEVESLFNSNEIEGLNVTIPYKVQIIDFLDEISDEAQSIGAVNVIQFKGNQKIGHNTDAYGFHQMIKPFLTNKHERALVLGTGGASKAVTYIFKSLGVDVISISRKPQGNKQYSYEDINDLMLNACKVIVNCTPVGTFPDINVVLDFPFQFLTKEHLVIDLIYNPSETEFLRNSKKNGATVLNGEAMLKHQALKAWEIWNS